jgi:hypothetical protein
MKIKKLTLRLSILTFSVILLTACPKPDPSPEPVADTEVESAIDVSFANYIMTDVDMICSFLGENSLYQHFYVNVPGTEAPPTGTFTPIRDTGAKALVMAFNKTKCMDGRLRDGSVAMYYGKDETNPNANDNSKYYRDFGFVGKFSLSEYKVDGWLIKPYSGAKAYVYNKLTTDKYDPKQTNLTWLITGDFIMVHPTDTNKNIVWHGELYKTLANTSDPKVFNPSKQAAITWSLATVHYHGKVEGMTSRTVPFRMEINAATPLVRDFTCFPDKVLTVVATPTTGGNVVLTQRFEEHHPFIKGIASFTTGYNTDDEKYPRQIYYGNEGSPLLPAQCDNTGEVLIKGISYKVNFRK